ncbi:MAG TPA: phage tail protein, partial [Candidatus Methanoperedens sp.]
INWVKTAKIEKINDDRTIKITGEKNFLSLRLNDKKTIAKLEIHNFGTYEFIAIVENDEVNIYEESDEDRFDMISCLFHPRFTFLFDKRDKTSIPRIEEEHNKRFRSFFSTGMDDFLIWFAGWMGLALKENWDLHTKREIIAKIIPLYRIRGTKKGLEEYLKIFTESDVEIIEELVSFQVGISSHIGKDTRLGGLPPNHFMININLPASDIESRKREILEEIINTEKPVHVSYNLNIKYV